MNTRGLLLPSRRRLSGIGALGDHTVIRNTIFNENQRLWGPFIGQLQLVPSHRMASTVSSSNQSEFKKRESSETIRSGSNTTGKSPNDKKENQNTEPSKLVASDIETPDEFSFKAMMKKYGVVFFGTYFAIYCSTVLGLFMSVQSGHLDVMYIISLITGTSSPTDPGGVADPETILEAKSTVKHLVEFLESYTLTKPVAPMVEEYPSIGNLAIAWIATKFTEPIRFGATVALTPPIARFVGYKRVSPVIENAGPIDIVSADQKGGTSSSEKTSP
ncbi:unnamed protein product [Pseudo-nitzschia multistriata]|uniref:DUF1279 domain-containing protein n=1 Tax=Pseudo-nitzschia multistriata TaxID=183589 RepID=A0A448ZF53_9STRA|nr:unnamed protein product [Pseudo-nitzschia multistriata]